MGVTEEELDEKRQRIADLREDIARAEEEKAREIQKVSNEAESASLDAEEKRLEAQLAALNEEPAPVEEPDLDNATPLVVEPKAAPSTVQTPTSVVSNLDAAKDSLKSVDAPKTETKE